MSKRQRQVLLMAGLAGLPGAVLALALLWTSGYPLLLRLPLSALILFLWWRFAFAAEAFVVRRLQTISNVVASLRAGDFSVRARGAHPGDALGSIIAEVNALGETLREQRLGTVEATALLRTVMAEIDVAVFAFGDDARLRLVNRAGERLLAQPAEQVLGLKAAELGLQGCLDGEAPRTLQLGLPGGSGRWGLSRSVFREGGRPHELVVLTDLRRALREEERQAWQRLLRVLGHELNNSLAPIQSIAGSLETIVNSEALPADWRDDVRSGLSVIAARAEALSRFLEAYSRVARLPPPAFSPVDVGAWVRRVVGLERRASVRVIPGPEITIEADAAQLDQLLINLVRNAVEAALETGGGVQVGWRKDGKYVEVEVRDAGPGLPSSANLFVPFFTTKPGGSGIGLVLSRQIAEAHGGSLTLRNRTAGKGCEARLRLPV